MHLPNLIVCVLAFTFAAESSETLLRGNGQRLIPRIAGELQSSRVSSSCDFLPQLVFQRNCGSISKAHFSNARLDAGAGCELHAARYR